ncbi:MAG: Hsp20/alpha crystallin family protein [bacterium]
MFGKKDGKVSKIFASKNDEKKIKTRDESEDWMQDYEGQLAIDVYQTNDDVLIKAPIAGVKPENLDVSVTDGILTIKGERKQEETVKDQDFFAQECYWGAFARQFTLPTGIDSEKTNASLKNGVLTIKIPKEEKTKTRTIQINAEEE